MANEIKAVDLKECTFILRDGTSPTPFELELKIDEGNMTWTESRNLKPIKDRGVLDYIKEEDEENCKVTVQCRFDAITSSSGDYVTVEEFLKGVGAASAYKTTGPPCAARAVDIIVKVNRICNSGITTPDEIITFADFTYSEIGGDFKAGTLSLQGMLNSVGPTSVRSTIP